MRIALASLTVLITVLSPGLAQAESDWALSVYGGQWVGAANGDVMSLEFRDNYLAGLGVLYEFDQSPPHVRWELEGKILQHLGQQHHEEFDLDLAVWWWTYTLYKWCDN